MSDAQMREWLVKAGANEAHARWLMGGGAFAYGTIRWQRGVDGWQIVSESEGGSRG